MNDRVPISGERTGFANSAKSLNTKKYGATNKKPVAAPHLAQPQSFVSHQVVPGDTIQGLSLRYGVTPELIKRCNNLYTNDSIHLKTCIKIPVLGPALASSQSDHCLNAPVPSSSSSSLLPLPTSSSSSSGLPPPPLQADRDSPSGPSNASSTLPPPPQASPSIGAGVPPIASFDAIIPGLSLPPPKRNSPKARLTPSISTPESLNSLQSLPRNPEGSLLPVESGEEKSVSSILNKIDSMLLKSKEDVKQYEKRKTDFVANEDDESYSYQSGSAFHYYPHGRSSRSGHQKLRQEGYTDLDGSPELVIKGGAKRKEGKKSAAGTTGGRRANHAGLGYGELEEDEDVIFEL